ncbi:MAG: zinc-ribbon domain-containing protein, partial [Deltaproteobacteria bacterium]|nr:zinc-ribbon domain-containing protein [Deltaproteobacteria bacterium]
MKFLCPKCKHKYQIADERIAGKTLKMDCRKCGHTFLIHPDLAIREPSGVGSAPTPVPSSVLNVAAIERIAKGGSAPSAPSGAAAHGLLGTDFQKSIAKTTRTPPPPPPAPPNPLDQWYVAINGVPVGPMKREEIVRRIAQGEVTEGSL